MYSFKNNQNGKWVARATYADGTEIEKTFAYTANGNYEKECEEQYNIECWLLNKHDDCTWYSVDYEEG